MEVRNLIAEDLPSIHAMLTNVRVFKPQEIQCALEIIDLYLNNPLQNDYHLKCIVDDLDKPLGYVCYGKTPLTDAVYDLYWIAVEPLYQSKGLGGILLEYVEKEIIKEKARMLIVETSSQEIYEPTRIFYLRRDFLPLASIPDFYEIGDGKIIFVKRFDHKSAAGDPR